MFTRIGQLIGVVAAVMTVGFSAPALAVTTLEFTGTIDSSTTTGWFPNLDGTSFSGTFSYDEAAADISSSTSVGQYNSTGAGYGATVTGGGYDLLIPAGAVHNDLSNNAFVDQYTLFASNTLSVPGEGDFYIQLMILLTDLSGNAIVSDGLFAPTLAAFGLSSVQIFVREVATGLTGRYDGTLTSLTVVPVPAALPLLGAGLAALGFMGWRKKRAVAA